MSAETGSEVLGLLDRILEWLLPYLGRRRSRREALLSQVVDFESLAERGHTELERAISSGHRLWPGFVSAWRVDGRKTISLSLEEPDSKAQQLAAELREVLEPHAKAMEEPSRAVVHLNGHREARLVARALRERVTYLATPVVRRLARAMRRR